MSYSVTLWLVNETLESSKYLTNLVKLVSCRTRLMVVKFYSHLNGVQGVASSNPATPTNRAGRGILCWRPAVIFCTSEIEHLKGHGLRLD